MRCFARPLSIRRQVRRVTWRLTMSCKHRAASMANDPNPHTPGPAPIEPKKQLPGGDEHFPGQPPIVDVERGPKATEIAEA